MQNVSVAKYYAFELKVVDIGLHQTSLWYMCKCAMHHHIVTVAHINVQYIEQSLMKATLNILDNEGYIFIGNLKITRPIGYLI